MAKEIRERLIEEFTSMYEELSSLDERVHASWQTFADTLSLAYFKCAHTAKYFNEAARKAPVIETSFEQWEMANLLSSFIKQKSFTNEARIWLDKEKKGLKEWESWIHGIYLASQFQAAQQALFLLQQEQLKDAIEQVMNKVGDIIDDLTDQDFFDTDGLDISEIFEPYDSLKKLHKSTSQLTENFKAMIALHANVTTGWINILERPAPNDDYTAGKISEFAGAHPDIWRRLSQRKDAAFITKAKNYLKKQKWPGNDTF